MCMHVCMCKYACMYDTMDSESVPTKVLAEMPRDLNQGLTKDLVSNYDLMYGRKNNYYFVSTWFKVFLNFEYHFCDTHYNSLCL